MNSSNGTAAHSIVKFHGGLGNQLFQYALGRQLSLNGPVTFDRSWFGTQTKRRYELGGFNVKVEFAADEELASWHRRRPLIGWRGLAQRLLGRTSRQYRQDPQYRFDPSILTTKPPAYFDGYWQSAKYFPSVTEQLRQELTLTAPTDPANSAVLGKIEAAPAISLHIRRGDYVTDAQANSVHGTPADAYYQQAVRRMKEIEPNGILFVFSDDPAWVKSNLRFDLPTEFVDINSADRGYEDLHLMSACRHNILANSTFSWWGAWLNRYPGKQVIAPARWFADPRIDASDLIPDNWITL